MTGFFLDVLRRIEMHDEHIFIDFDAFFGYVLASWNKSRRFFQVHITHKKLYLVPIPWEVEKNNQIFL